MKPINILCRINHVDHTVLINMRGERGLHQYTVDARIAIKRRTAALENFLPAAPEKELVQP